jgi:hypothetical protein
MYHWILAFASKLVRRTPDSTPSHCPTLEQLEDRCMPSAGMMMPMGMPTPLMNVQPMGMQAMTMPSTNMQSMGMNTIASLPHEQIHVLQSQSQQQVTDATFTLAVEQFALGILQPFAPQAPQFQPLIATLTNVIPAQQAVVQTLQNQLNLLDQLDDLQDQALILGAVIQNGTPLVPVLQQIGDVQAANRLQNTITQDQAAVLALQPQIVAVEQQVSAFV